jgi:hypothetical protein
MDDVFEKPVLCLGRYHFAQPAVGTVDENAPETSDFGGNRDGYLHLVAVCHNVRLFVIMNGCLSS